MYDDLLVKHQKNKQISVRKKIKNFYIYRGHREIKQNKTSAPATMYNSGHLIPILHTCMAMLLTGFAWLMYVEIS